MRYYEEEKLKQNSKNNLASRIYSNQKRSSLRRGHRPPDYNAKELKEWLFSQPLFHSLYSEWKNSSWKKSLVPSVDRKNDEIHYCFNNIQLCTWEENNRKYQDDKLNGIDKKKNKPVVMIDKVTDVIIKEFYSAKEAYRQMQFSSYGNLNEALNGKRKTAYGYKWKYKREVE